MGFPCSVIMNIMASRIYRNVNFGVFRFRQRANGPSDMENIKLNGHRMDEISLNQTGIGSGIGSGVSGGDNGVRATRCRKKLDWLISLSENTECDYFHSACYDFYPISIDF